MYIHWYLWGQRGRRGPSMWECQGQVWTLCAPGGAPDIITFWGRYYDPCILVRILNGWISNFSCWGSFGFTGRSWIRCFTCWRILTPVSCAVPFAGIFSPSCYTIDLLLQCDYWLYGIGVLDVHWQTSESLVTIYWYWGGLGGGGERGIIWRPLRPLRHVSDLLYNLNNKGAYMTLDELAVTSYRSARIPSQS